MKRGLIAIVAVLFFFQFISCNDELVVDQKEQIKPSENPNLSKEGDLLSTQQDSISLKEKKDRMLRLKKEHDKPYVVIEKPEKLLAEKLKSRTPSKSISQPSKNSKLNSVQGIQSCYTLEIDVWALERYHSKPNFIVGIWPKQNANWSYNQGTLSSFKKIYGYSKILLIRGAIYTNTVYNPHDILAGADACNIGTINSYTDFDTTASGSLWGFYTDEPINRDDPLDLYVALQNMYYTKSWWKYKFGQNSKMIVGETNQFDAQNFSWLADYINCTRYTRYSDNGFILSNDQRGLWDQFNNLFHDQFNHLWISGDSDYDEIDVLIGYAKVMPRNSIWLYAAETGVNDGFYWNTVNKFSYYSFVHNYLQREEKRFVYVWNYIGNGDPCTDYQITSWDLIDIIETNDKRIL